MRTRKLLAIPNCLQNSSYHFHVRAHIPCLITLTMHPLEQAHNPRYPRVLSTASFSEMPSSNSLKIMSSACSQYNIAFVPCSINWLPQSFLCLKFLGYISETTLSPCGKTEKCNTACYYRLSVHLKIKLLHSYIPRVASDPIHFL